MAKRKTVFECEACGYRSSKWMGRCPDCGGWSTFLERKETEEPAYRGQVLSQDPPRPIHEIREETVDRIETGNSEVDRVLGGGLVPGSLILIGGEPGIGKSTLMLQVCQLLAKQGRKVVYFSGEESPSQIRIRGDRIGCTNGNILVSGEVTVEGILDQLASSPGLAVVDSIQTVFSKSLTSAPGTVSQIREATTKFLYAAKRSGIPLVIIGHITKEGSIAGPKTLEHIVDTVLYFEGERYHSRRVIRSVKNRFGSTNEVGIFDMTAGGLEPVPNPSAAFLSERAHEAAGSAIVSAIEGTRAILLEVQALAAESGFGTPRRMGIGVDANRLHLLLAIMEKRLDFAIQRDDVYVNITGGFAVQEPAIDLGIAFAVASGFMNRPLDPEDLFVGEVGLSGEIRSVSQLERRLREARSMGFKRAFVPPGFPDQVKALENDRFRIEPVKTLRVAFDRYF